MMLGIRRKFIRIALLVLALAMVLVAVTINAANWVGVRAELTETLDALVQAGERPGGLGPRGRRSRGLQNRISESRYFSVTLDEAGNVRMNGNTRQSEYSGEELREIARRALAGGRAGGFFEKWLFRVEGTEDGLRSVVFLNCETRLAAVRALALISAAACLGAILLAWLLVSLFSSRAIRPMLENAVQQKQFITDAGHELKTPLTVISANMDVLALETGENEWIRSTQKQVANLRGLVGELIYLSRLDEEGYALARNDVNLAAVLREEAEPFAGMAEFAGKRLEISAEADLTLKGDEAALRRLISVLLDNAVKYAPEGDAIAVSLRSNGRKAALAVENGLTAPMEEDALKHLFDRFYRVDASRSKESGGYGIGLSVARAVAEKHGGSIRARLTDAGRLRIAAVLPMGGRR